MLIKDIFHMRKLYRHFGLIIAAFLLPSMSMGQQESRSYPPVMPGSNIELYKTANGVDLRIWIFSPEEHKIGDSRPAIVFFFGGGWRKGNPIQFQKHCEYLAARGMMALIADYRVRSRHEVKADKCVADAKSAIRWIRENAKRLGIDPDRIAAGGGSAGGHLAAATATLPAHDDPNDDLSISARPNALVLFNPASILESIPGGYELTNERIISLQERMGADPKSMSPFHHICSGTPPVIIFHGVEDTTVPYQSVELFTEKMKETGNHCELVGYSGEGHGFFNFARSQNAPFIDTVYRMDTFLVSLGYLKGVSGVTHQK